MNKTGKRVDIVMAIHDHPPEQYMQCGVPILKKAQKGTRAVQFMGKEVTETTPTHDCPDWSRNGVPAMENMEPVAVPDGSGKPEYIYRYDEGGDQICTNCGHVRNDSPDVVHDHQHAGRYDGFNADSAKKSA